MRIWIISKLLWYVEYIFFYPKLTKKLNSLFPSPSQNQVIFDVGGNSGQTVKIFRKVFPNSLIYSFEPNPIIFKTLATLNNRNTFCYNVGLSKEMRKSDFYISKFSETSSLKLPNSNSKWNLMKMRILGIDNSEIAKKIEIDLVTVDFLVEDLHISEIFLLKIDVEGSELEVLEGALGSLLTGKIRHVQFEELRNDLYLNNFEKIDSLLSKNNFERVFSLKHSFGNFYEHFYSLKR